MLLVTYSDIQLGYAADEGLCGTDPEPVVLEEEVVQGMGLDLTYEQMKEKVSVTTPTDTRILAITVKDSDPVMAMRENGQCDPEAAAVHIMNMMDIKAVNVGGDCKHADEKGESQRNTKRIRLLAGCLGYS